MTKAAAMEAEKVPGSKKPTAYKTPTPAETTDAPNVLKTNNTTIKGPSCMHKRVDATEARAE